MRAGHSFAFGFPSESSAEDAAAALSNPGPRADLGRVLRALDAAAALEVEWKGQLVTGQALLHDDVDVWASEGGGPSTATLWRAIEQVVEKHGGQPIQPDPGRAHDGSTLTTLVPAALQQDIVTGEPNAEERIRETIRADGLATTLLLGGYHQVPWTARGLCLETKAEFYADLARLPWLRSLEVRPKRLCDLTGIDQVRRLESLIVSSKRLARGERLEELTWVTPLTSLKVLEATGSSVADLSPLASLVHLERVALAKTKVSDLSPLQENRGLRELALGDTPIRDLTPLSDLTQLELVDLKNTRVADLSPLAGLHGLRHLRLSNSKTRDLSPLSGLVRLERLELDGTKVSDVSALSQLTALERLELNDTKVADLSPLAELTQLEWLSLRRTAISDVTPLLNLQRLERLTIRSTKVSKESLAHLASALPQCKIVGP